MLFFSSTIMAQKTGMDENPDNDDISQTLVFDRDANYFNYADLEKETDDSEDDIRNQITVNSDLPASGHSDDIPVGVKEKVSQSILLITHLALPPPYHA